MKTNYAAILEGDKVVPVDSIMDPRYQAMWEGSQASRIVRRTSIRKRAEVSTVFLGINHGWGNEDIWFETMIFGGYFSGYEQRYRTIAEARSGHEKAVRMARGGIISLFLLYLWRAALATRKLFNDAKRTPRVR